jgi:acyl-CoA dehydrogenase family protein 9
VFEGANDVLRSYVALTALKPLGEALEGLTKIDFSTPVQSLGTIAEYVGGRVQREVRPDRVTKAHESLKKLADPISDQVKRLRDAGETLLRKHGKDIVNQGMAHKRYSHALSDLYAQVAVISRVTQIFSDQGVEASGQEQYIAETFCTRAERRVMGMLDRIEKNDDDRMHSIARLAYKRGSYGYALFDEVS